VSNVVKHGRSFSDRGIVGPGKPAGNSMVHEISSPIVMGTPQLASQQPGENGTDALRAALRRAQLHITELETDKLVLTEKLNSSFDISAVNTELREKRSTMAFLDTQREMIVRELEVMTEQLTRAKDSGKTLDLASLKTNVLKDFAESLQKLKDHMGNQIEELIHKRNELTDEIGNLIQMKDKGFQEYESLSSKNVQLQQHNGELLRNIQGMYQDNRSAHTPAAPAGPNGLGIFTSSGSTSRTETPTVADSRKLSLVTTNSSAAMLPHEHEAEPAAVLAAPQVVNIRKDGKAAKFNWRRGGEKVAKNVTRGLKGAFTNNDKPPPSATLPPGQYSIGMPYSQTVTASAGSDLASQSGNGISSGASVHSRNEDNKSGTGFGFFGQKNTGTNNGNLRPGNGMKSNSATNLELVDGSVLYGSDLVARCEFEGRVIPSIVTRCIQEVEWRGMEVEGIYRKSGGAGQVKSVQQGFEKDANHDISDADLDIHAVTSAMKQYFRKLPNPLITFEAYEQFLEAGQAPKDDKEKQVMALRVAIGELPEAHRDCLQFLIQHLVRIMSHEPQNLMTQLNLAVVFAPTIMRPQSIEREMSDMQAQRTAIQFLLENYRVVFAADD